MKKRVRFVLVVASILLLLLVAATSYEVFGMTSPAPAAANGEADIPATPPDELHVLSYNVFLRPKPISARDYTQERAKQIGQWLAGADVDIAALQEAWDPDAVSLILEEVKDKLPYFVVGQPGRATTKLTSGGLLILSRWPIEQMRTLVYDQCNWTDCLATKGAVHVVIHLATNSYLNFVTTHLDAGKYDRDYKARATQVEQLRQFIAQIDSNVGPTLIAGDFNVDALTGDGEYELLTSTLAVEPDATAMLSTINCDLEESISCEAPQAPRHIDYIFIRSGEQQLSLSETRQVPLATNAIDAHVRYLSDHRAVLATLATAFR
jgi:endonuclease/exonuclease/phosphatase family metal-dependent hydrolase